MLQLPAKGLPEKIYSYHGASPCTLCPPIHMHQIMKQDLEGLCIEKGEKCNKTLKERTESSWQSK